MGSIDVSSGHGLLERTEDNAGPSWSWEQARAGAEAARKAAEKSEAKRVHLREQKANPTRT